MSEETAKWIEKKHLAWQSGREKKGTVTEFAIWLGVSRGTYNNWVLKKQTPQGDSVKLLADKLGPEIYSLVGMTPPDPRLEAIVKWWDKLSEEARNAISADAERYAAEKPDGELAASKRKRKV